MERKNKNICLTVIPVIRTPSLVVNINWHCPQANWYTLYKLKKGYKTMDPQFKEGSECMALCYSLFQRVKERKGTPYMSKYPIDCLSCNVQNNRFQISYTTSNKLSYLKRTLKDVIKELDPTRIHKQYAINMRNLGVSVNKDEENYVISELIKSLKKEVCIVASGSIKLTSTKGGKKVSESQNLNNLASYLSDQFPKLLEPKGKKSKPKSVDHKVPPEKSHVLLRTKNDKYGVMPNLVADYIGKTLSIHATPLSVSVIVWNKDPSAKLKSIKNADRYKREMLNKKDINEWIVYKLLSTGADGKKVVKFYKANPTPSALASAVVAQL